MVEQVRVEFLQEGDVIISYAGGPCGFAGRTVTGVPSDIEGNPWQFGNATTQPNVVLVPTDGGRIAFGVGQALVVERDQ